jgi:hypothetical protein
MVSHDFVPDRHHTFYRRPSRRNLYIPAHAAGPGASLVDMLVPANNDAANLCLLKTPSALETVAFRTGTG